MSARQESRLAISRWLVALWGRPVNASIFIGHRLHPPHDHAMVAARAHTEGGSTWRDSGGAASRGSNGTPPLLIGATSFKDPRRTRSPTGSCESQLLPLAAPPLAARPRRPCRPGRHLCQPVTGLLDLLALCAFARGTVYPLLPFGRCGSTRPSAPHLVPSAREQTCEPQAAVTVAGPSCLSVTARGWAQHGDGARHRRRTRSGGRPRRLLAPFNGWDSGLRPRAAKTACPICSRHGVWCQRRWCKLIL